MEFIPVSHLLMACSFFVCVCVRDILSRKRNLVLKQAVPFKKCGDPVLSLGGLLLLCEHRRFSVVKLVELEH